MLVNFYIAFPSGSLNCFVIIKKIKCLYAIALYDGNISLAPAAASC